MAHTFSLAGGVNLPLRTRISGNFTYSLRLQNDDFLPHTINPALACEPGPRAAAEEPATATSQTILVQPERDEPAAADPVTFTAKYRLYDLIDDSDVVTFSDFVINDQNAVAPEPHGSQRFSYMRAERGRWTPAGRSRGPLALTLGAGWERWDRNEHREVPVSDEFFAKAALDVTPVRLADGPGHVSAVLPADRRSYNTLALAARRSSRTRHPARRASRTSCASSTRATGTGSASTS